MWLLLVVSGVICHSYALEKALSKSYRFWRQMQRVDFSPRTLLLFVVPEKLLRTLTLDSLIYKMKTIPCCCFETQSHYYSPDSSCTHCDPPASVKWLRLQVCLTIPFLLNFQVGKIYKIVGFVMTFSCSCVMMLCSKSYSCPHGKYKPYL